MYDSHIISYICVMGIKADNLAYNAHTFTYWIHAINQAEA